MTAYLVVTGVIAHAVLLGLTAFWLSEKYEDYQRLQDRVAALEG